MTAKNCTNGPKLVLKDLCEKSFVQNVLYSKLPVCRANKKGFCVKPQFSNLTPLEERLISLRIAFMHLPEVPRRGQLSIHGNVVNVLGNVNSTDGTLPRPINETIPIKLE